MNEAPIVTPGCYIQIGRRCWHVDSVEPCGIDAVEVHAQSEGEHRSWRLTRREVPPDWSAIIERSYATWRRSKRHV